MISSSERIRSLKSIGLSRIVRAQPLPSRHAGKIRRIDHGER
jgi:hypothetical protein